ncbi:MAG: hypothetical protein Q4B48_06475 [Syntrophomonadaceae bacterium]|nr:hypothetical protein [Syntrophomonadaceae bacterium]
MSVKAWLIAWGRLMLIHLFAVLAVWLAMYYPGLDIALAVLYLLMVLLEFAAVWQWGGKWWQSLLLLIVWQLPLLVCVVTFWSGSYSAESILYWAFAQQMWLTPLLPLLAATWPQITIMGSVAVALFTAIFFLSWLLRSRIKAVK